MDNPEFNSRLARRCRELMSRTTVEGVREHLALMAAELEAQAALIDHELNAANSAASDGRS